MYLSFPGLLNRYGCLQMNQIQAVTTNNNEEVEISSKETDTPWSGVVLSCLHASSLIYPL